MTASIRVLLTRYTGARSITVLAPSGARLTDSLGSDLNTGDSPWTFRAAGAHLLVHGNGPAASEAEVEDRVHLAVSDSAGLLSIQTGARRAYRGSLDIYASAAGIKVVNEVQMEDYLCGVVSAEMGGGAPFEALKAQAVASRSFVLNSRGRGAAAGYDVKDSTDSQVYGGVTAETSAGNRAVLATSGEILVQQGVPIFAQYCANCGGSSESVLGGGPADDSEAHSTLSGARKHEWTVRLTSEAVASALARSPAASAGIVTDLQVTDAAPGGRVNLLTVTWSPRIPLAAEAPASGEPAGTSLANGDGDNTPASASVGVNGQAPPPVAAPVPATVSRRFTAAQFRNILGPNRLKSTVFTISKNPDGSFTINGRGWGHGRGMCQDGAAALAGAPFRLDYRSILMRYYAGAELRKADYLEPEEDGSTVVTARQIAPISH